MTGSHPSSPGAWTRRGVLQVGGVSAALAAVLAACGRPGDGAPGRVGNAPDATSLPTVVVDDAVLLRTIGSLEYSAIEAHERIKEAGGIDDRAAALVDRMIEDHTRHAETIGGLIEEAGGERYECANPWYSERVIGPLFERVEGNPDAEIEPSDDPARDLVTIAYAIESMLTATYQELVEQVADPALRQPLVELAAEEGRHAAAFAIARDGAPEAYVSPLVYGEQIDTAATDGVLPLYAIDGAFGSLAPVELTLGPTNDAGTRFATAVPTPADNAYRYAGDAC